MTGGSPAQPGDVVTERAPGKVNLVLQVGSPREDGLHPLCSLFATVDLADEVRVEVAGSRDAVVCPGVVGDNLAGRALAAFRAAAPSTGLAPLLVTIEKRIPVAAGMGGGSADAAAVLRAADTLSGAPLGAARLRALGAGVGADVPSQIEPRTAIVTGVGEHVEPVGLGSLWLVLVPHTDGLSTAAVYAELDRLRAAGVARPRQSLDPAPLRAMAAASPPEVAARVENDLQLAATSLRPDLARVPRDLGAAGALGAGITGSGPTAFGVFADSPAAESAARALPGSMVAVTQ